MLDKINKGIFTMVEKYTKILIKFSVLISMDNSTLWITIFMFWEKYDVDHTYFPKKRGKCSFM